MLVAAAKNLMLDAIGITHASLHSSYPGLTGTGELTGGSPAYARKAITYAAAAAGSKASSNTPLFDVPAGETVRWVGFWTAVSGGTYLGCLPNGGTEYEVDHVDAATDVVRAIGHPFADTNKIVFTGTSVPGGLTAGTIYFARDCATDTFKVAATAGGAAIDLTSAPAKDCVVSKIVEEAFAAQGKHQIDSVTHSLNV